MNPDPQQIQASFVGEFFKWFRALDHQKLVRIYEFSGGWEEWAQTELALYCDGILREQGLPAGLVEREPRKQYVEGSLRADLAIWWNKCGDKLLPFVCEMKCESFKQAKSFSLSVFGDLSKLQGLDKKTRSLVPIMIAVTITADNTNYCEKAFATMFKGHSRTERSSKTSFLLTTNLTVSPAIHVAGVW